jgi:TatD DNase family protein
MAVDAHIHLDLYDEAERAGLISEAFAAGVTGLVAVSMHPASCRINQQLALRYPDRVLPAYGHHPEQAPLPERELEQLCSWIAGLPRETAFAIGEVGLPYFSRQAAIAEGRKWDMAPYLRQLERFVELAAMLDRPLALHAVHEDADVVLAMLERHRIRRAHFHWFKGSDATIRRLIGNGYYISVTPEIRYDEETRRLASTYPIDLLLVETDGPWPFEGPYQNRRTVPGMVFDVIREIAELRKMKEADVQARLLANVRRCYGNFMPELPLL